MASIYRKVMVADRLPIKRGTYLTNKGYKKFCKKYLFYHEDIYSINSNIKIQWWLEEIELPTEDELSKESKDSYYPYSFEEGASYILNKLK